MAGKSIPRSGRFVIRMTPALHARLSDHAALASLSLNEYCVAALARGDAAPAGPLAGVLAMAIRQLGPDLVGVAIFGSYARGEAVESSDVDLLIVANPAMAITRALYAPWDQDTAFLGPHPIEPHFVRMPEPGDRITGLWAEVAMEGSVLFDPDLVLARRLAHVRRAIVEGLLVKRIVQGQSYWGAA